MPSAASQSSSPATPSANPGAVDPELSRFTGAPGATVDAHTLLAAAKARSAKETRYDVSLRWADKGVQLSVTGSIDHSVEPPKMRVSYDNPSTDSPPVDFTVIGDDTYVRQQGDDVVYYRMPLSSAPTASQKAFRRLASPLDAVGPGWPAGAKLRYEGPSGTGDQAMYMFSADTDRHGGRVSLSVDSRLRFRYYSVMRNYRPDTTVTMNGYGRDSYIEAPPASLVRPAPTRTTTKDGAPAQV